MGFIVLTLGVVLTLIFEVAEYACELALEAITVAFLLIRWGVIWVYLRIRLNGGL